MENINKYIEMVSKWEASEKQTRSLVFMAENKKDVLLAIADAFIGIYDVTIKKGDIMYCEVNITIPFGVYVV